jgi:diguanylate cyclase (GGDEF)-like protein
MTEAGLASASNELVRAFREIGRAGLSAPGLPEALSGMLEAVAPVLPDTCLSIMLFDQDRRDLITVAQRGLDEKGQRLRFKGGEGLAGWVAAKLQPAIVNDPSNDPRFVPGLDGGHPIKAIVAVPLYAMSLCAGVFNVHSLTRQFTPDDADLVELLAALMSAEIQRRRMAQLILTDSLTQVGNRRSFENVLRVETARALRYGNALSVIGLDVDNMRELNAKHGDRAGDVVLRNMSALLRGLLRTPDHLFRIGGDEFGILLPETDAAGGLRFAERARIAIEEWNHVSLAGLKVTVSLGVTTYQNGEEPERIIARMDDAELKAKQGGRNRAVAE